MNACWAKAVENDWNIINNNIKGPDFVQLESCQAPFGLFWENILDNLSDKQRHKTDNPNCFIVWAYNSCTVESPGFDDLDYLFPKYLSCTFVTMPV